MSLIEQQVKRAKVRLNTIIILDKLAVGLAIAGAAWSLLWVVERSFSFGLPPVAMIWIAAGLALVLTVAGWYRARVDSLGAAVAIDAAAGLKERVSTALTVMRSPDPFAHAAISDAEKTARSIHVPTHMPLRASPWWSWSAASVAVAGLLFMFMPQLNLLASAKAEDKKPEEARATVAEKKAVEVALTEQIEKVRKMAEANADLKDIAQDLEKLKTPIEPNATPEDVRRDALKKVDQLNEKLAEKRDSEQFKSLEEIKRRMAQIEPKAGDDPASKLSQALASGDTEAAKQEMSNLKKQLEEAAGKSDEETKKQLTEMAEKLDNLSKQMEKAADQSKMQKELENKAGMSAEDAKKLLEEMSKMDPKQMAKELQKRLGEKGMDQKQIQDLAKKLQQDQDVKKAMKEMAKKMQKASEQCKKQCQGQQPGGQGDPQQGEGNAMAEAMQQMSEMEMAEQMMNELEAQMAELQDMREGMCEGNGMGNKRNNKQGQQGGNEGLGYGAKVGKESAAHGYKASKIRSQSQNGQVIGQMLVDGPQVKGEIGSEVKEAVSSAVRDASDAIERESIPRQYHGVARRYFDSLAGLGGAAPRPATPPKKADTAEARRSDVESKDGD